MTYTDINNQVAHDYAALAADHRRKVADLRRDLNVAKAQLARAYTDKVAVAKAEYDAAMSVLRIGHAALWAQYKATKDAPSTATIDRKALRVAHRWNLDVVEPSEVANALVIKGDTMLEQFRATIAEGRYAEAEPISRNLAKLRIDMLGIGHSPTFPTSAELSRDLAKARDEEAIRELHEKLAKE